MPVRERRVIAGRRVLVVPAARPLAFCAGLLRPRVYVSTGALERLGEAELAAVVAHEAHHAARRDPLRILVARAIGDAYSLGALPRREQALAELAADAAVVRIARRGAAGLGAAGVRRRRGRARARRPARGRGAARRGPARRSWPARAVVIAALLMLLTAGLIVDGHPRGLPAAGVRAGLVAVRRHGAARGDGAGLARLAPSRGLPHLDISL